MTDTKFTVVENDKDCVRVHVEGARATDLDDDTDEKGEDQGNHLSFKFTHEGLIIDLVDKDGNVIGSRAEMYEVITNEEINLR